MLIDHVPLKRTFAEVPREVNEAEQATFGAGSGVGWEDMQNAYRTVILAPAGSGKTFEMLARAERMVLNAKIAFFIRIEDIDAEFETSFEVGTSVDFEAWLTSTQDAWFFLDSVDEARLENPEAFSRAMHRFAKKIKAAAHRSHVFISSRPYAWRFESDRALLERLLPFSAPKLEVTAPTAEGSEVLSAQPPKPALAIYSLGPLSEPDIRLFASYRSLTRIDEFITAIERANLMDMASRPYDLEAIIKKWKVDGSLGSRLELHEGNILNRLEETDPTKKFRRPLNRQKALEGARLLALAVILTGEAGFTVPDLTQNKVGIDPESILVDWDPKDVFALLERGIFNDIIYGAVRFRHREVRELLTAQCLNDLLKKGNSRRFVEALFFKKQYGLEVITPRLRPILPWLILYDEGIRRRALAISPDIAVEGGDPSALLFHERKKILVDIVTAIASDRDDRGGRDNAAIARIAQKDLAEVTQQLIQTYAANDDVIFFLGRLVWQGNMSSCTSSLRSIAMNGDRGVYARIASIRAIMTVSEMEERRSFWNEFLETQDGISPKLLVEFVREARTDSENVEFVLASIGKWSPPERYDSSGFNQAVHRYIDRLARSDDGGELLGRLTHGLVAYLEREPHLRDVEHGVSKQFSSLLSPAMHAVECLVLARDRASLSEPALSVLTMVPIMRFWRTESFDECKGSLEALVPAWPLLNDALFWRDIARKRTELEKEGKNLTIPWPAQWIGPYWNFGSDSFDRTLAFIDSRPLLDDRLVALSLSFKTFVDTGRPMSWEAELRAAVRGDPALDLRLNDLLAPEETRQPSEIELETKKWQRRAQARKLKDDLARTSWIERLKADPGLVASPPDAAPNTMTNDQYWLLREIQGDGLRTSRGTGTDWRSLIPIVGEAVATAFRDAVLSHWRRYIPGLRSEGCDPTTYPYALVLALVGLEIEAREVADFPTNLNETDALRATRYITWELNGFPTWLEPMYRAFPAMTKSAILQELEWELRQPPTEQPLHYIIEDIVGRAPWLHGIVSESVMSYFDGDWVRDPASVARCIKIIESGEPDVSRIVALAQQNAALDDPAEVRAKWYGLWVGRDPETGIPALEAWLTSLSNSEATVAAQHFATALLGSSRHGGAGGTDGREFCTAPHLKTLYVLMHRYVRLQDDIERANMGVYSPSLRDHAQDARNQLFNILTEIPGKATFIALHQLSLDHPEEAYRAWMAKCMQKRAEIDADVEPWKPEQVSDLWNLQRMQPVSHRQLFDVGVLHLQDFKDWLERGNDSLAETYQRVSGETEMRKVVANWLNIHAKGRYTCAQENPLANDQRPDIWLQHSKVALPVPIELKLLDKDWSGPGLCERLRNQLAGDYLREAERGCGVMLLIWKGTQPNRKWDIAGKRVDVSGIGNALADYWSTISHCFPTVTAIEIVVIDLTLRNEKSARTT
ncbi:hypothetical protein [Rhizobium sp. L245/93]|uniref:NACHT domain-containing protein n=1 Tax=Rhizobium sp. L245/93 TaxID=2819998 RepID=UPI001ADA1931|nr:hypothetical protein [Rhizobium sp. L245/93]MBO9170038.1 hypothetical protein [Rhizobium sp. L245/93]